MYCVVAILISMTFLKHEWIKEDKRLSTPAPLHESSEQSYRLRRIYGQCISKPRNTPFPFFCRPTRRLCKLCRDGLRSYVFLFVTKLILQQSPSIRKRIAKESTFNPIKTYKRACHASR